MRKLLLGAIFVLLVSCNGGSGSATSSGGDQNGSSLVGTYKYGPDQGGDNWMFTFGPGNRIVVQADFRGCVSDRDTGTFQIQVVQGVQYFSASLTSGVTADLNSQAACAPLITASSSQLTRMTPGMYQFSWVVADSSFDLSVSTLSKRFQRI